MSAAQAAAHPAASRRQTVTGLAIAAGLIGGWLTIHIWAIMLHQWTLAQAPLAVTVIVMQAWLSTGLFITAHDAMHGSLAPGRPWLNRALGTLCLAIYAGLSYAALFPKHHDHHRHSGTELDPDFNAADPRALVPWFVRFFLGYYTHGQIARITVVAVIYMVAFDAPLLNIALFWAVPALLALGQLFVFGTYLPHRHGREAFADAHHARSQRSSTLASLLTCFHFGGYHHEHHLSPGTPWWRLPKVIG